MKTVLKKNQIIVFVIGLMIITAGYFSYSNNSKNDPLKSGSITDSEEMTSIGDAKLVSANVAENNVEVNNINSLDTNSNTITNNISNTIENDVEGNLNEIVSSSNDVETVSSNTGDYFTSSRLDRNTMYSQRIENYQDILNNTNVSEAQKKTAQEEITKLNNEQNAIMIAENLIKTKGIEDLVIFINGESINVIVKGKDLEKEEIAQIQNIITRELEADIGNIHIMNKE